MHAVTPKAGVAKPAMRSGQWGGEGWRGEMRVSEHEVTWYGVRGKCISVGTK